MFNSFFTTAHQSWSIENSMSDLNRLRGKRSTLQSE
uniref:Squamosa promoter-binding-like protein 1 isoform X2 n=1 Tax=Rhizophora mucronata TaxID=61149 RepID=A0A2P2JEF6_RHIMU